jgi:hypothetical protein
MQAMVMLAVLGMTLPDREKRDGIDCDRFKRGKPSGDCQGDGHYQCRECTEHEKSPSAGEGEG